MDNFDLKKYLAEGRLLKEEQNKLPLETIQDMYSVASTVDQGYEPDYDVKGAEKKEKEYKQKYPNEYSFVSSVSAYDEYAGPDDEPITDEEALEVVGYTLDQIKGI
jgi:hypothetical protein